MGYREIFEQEPVPKKGIIVLIYGDPGVGKTSLSFTAENPALLDFDTGLSRSVGRKYGVQFDNWPDILEFMDSGRLDEIDAKTLILDTAGTMIDDFIGSYVAQQDDINVRGSGELSLAGYGAIKSVFRRFLNEKIKPRGMDLILICHMTSDDTGKRVRNKPKMSGGSYDIIMSACDMVGHMEMRNEKITLDFNPTDNYVGKNCGKIKRLNVPDFESKEYGDAMAKIISDTKARMNEMNEKQVEAINLVQELKEQISQTNDLASIEGLKLEHDNLSPLYRSQIDQFWNERFCELWCDQFLTDKCDSPDSFAVLSDSTSELPKPIRSILKPRIVEFMKSKGVEYDAKKQEFYSTVEKTEPKTPEPDPGTSEEDQQAEESKPDNAGEAGKDVVFQAEVEDTKAKEPKLGEKKKDAKSAK